MKTVWTGNLEPSAGNMLVERRLGADATSMFIWDC
jgi:hypothetical protein